MAGPRGRRTSIELRSLVVNSIHEAVTQGARVTQACKVAEISYHTYLSWRLGGSDNRKGPITKPKNALTDKEKQEIIDISLSAEHVDLPVGQLVVRLVDQGIFIASERTFYRVMHAQRLIQHRGRARPRQHRLKPGPIEAKRPNTLWAWDITYLPAKIIGTYYYLYMVEDIFSRKIVAQVVNAQESSFLASQLIEEATRENLVNPGEMTLHADNGGPMRGMTMLAMLQRLGIASSFSRPRQSNDNAFVESLFSTLKYCPFYPPDRFESLEDAQKWVNAFVPWYNEVCYHSGINWVTPASRHAGLDSEILAQRKIVYEQARILHPLRWSGRIRNWDPVGTVYLNAHHAKKKQSQKSMGMP
jgi:transposase InsO family protein